MQLAQICITDSGHTSEAYVKTVSAKIPIADMGQGSS